MKSKNILLYVLRMLPKAVNLVIALDSLDQEKRSPSKIKWPILIFLALIASAAAAYQTDRTEPQLKKIGQDLPKGTLTTAQSRRLFILADKAPPPLMRQPRFRCPSILKQGRLAVAQAQAQAQGFLSPTHLIISPEEPTLSACNRRMLLAGATNFLGLLAAVIPFGSSIFLLFTDNPLAFYGIATMVILLVGMKNILCEAPPTQDRITQYAQPMTWPSCIPLSVLQFLLGSYARLDAAIAGGSGGKLGYDLLPEEAGLYRLLLAIPLFLSIYFSIKTLNESFDSEKALLRYGDQIDSDTMQRILSGQGILPPRQRTCIDFLAQPLHAFEKVLLELSFFPRNNMLWLKCITLVAYMSRQAYIARKASERFDLNMPQMIIALGLCLVGAIAPALSAIRLKTRAIPEDHPIMQEALVIRAFQSVKKQCCPAKPNLDPNYLLNRKNRVEKITNQEVSAGSYQTPGS